MRSSFICTFEGTLLLINNILRRLPCPFNGDCSAGRLYRCAWRARSRRPHTHATCERRIDAKASSDEAVEDVEVDRCIDENSASNHAKVALLVFLSPKLHWSSLLKMTITTRPNSASREPNIPVQSQSQGMEAPCLHGWLCMGILINTYHTFILRR